MENIRIQDTAFRIAKNAGLEVNGLFIKGDGSSVWDSLKEYVNTHPNLGLALLSLIDGEIIVRKTYKEV